ncbi:MAG: hypothetical protein GY775_16740 [Candidatus Scalindua sp.]|nr:hypothetical protein [Candidatus Scalindua sp.]
MLKLTNFLKKGKNIKQGNLEDKAENIKTLVCETVGIPLEDISKKSRKEEVVTARQLFCYYCLRLTNLTLAAMGKKVNIKHSTALHGIRKIKRERKFNKMYDTYCDQIEDHLS